MWRKLSRKVNNDGSNHSSGPVSVVVLVLALYACSPIPRQKTLAFFFDGVPEYADSAQNKGANPVLNTELAVVDKTPAKVPADLTIYHPPYKKKQCASCHDQNVMGKFVLPQPALCYQCHKDYSQVYKVVHGPVGGGYCTNCHFNHSGKNEKLLRRVDRDLCLNCHVDFDIQNNSAHKENSNEKCIKCHNPHGGQDHALVK